MVLTFIARFESQVKSAKGGLLTASGVVGPTPNGRNFQDGADVASSVRMDLLIAANGVMNVTPRQVPRAKEKPNGHVHN